MNDSKTRREQSLLSYVADLELEVDRLRTQLDFLQQSSSDFVKQVVQLPENTSFNPSDITTIKSAARQLGSILHDVRAAKGYHPAHDQVVAFAIRPLVEQVFRWQQRVSNAASIELDLQLASDHLEWFPARFRHILDNLIASAMNSCINRPEANKILVGFETLRESYELTVADNGQVVTDSGRSVSLELFYRSSPARSATTRISLAVVETLVDACGGKCTITSNDGYANVVGISLPRYDSTDYIN